MANAQPGPTTPTRTPLSTGPSIAPNWNVDDTMLIALRTWVTPTISGTHERRSEDIDVPGLDRSGEGQNGEQGGHHGHAGLGGLEDATLVEAVGEHPRVEPEEQGRQELEGGRETDGSRAVGQRQDQPVLGDALDPGPRSADEETGQEQSKVAVAERGEGPGRGLSVLRGGLFVGVGDWGSGLRGQVVLVSVLVRYASCPSSLDR